MSGFVDSLARKILRDEQWKFKEGFEKKVKRAPKIEVRENGYGVLDVLQNAKNEADWHKRIEQAKKDHPTNKIQHGGTPYGDKGPNGPTPLVREYLDELEKHGYSYIDVDIEVLKAAAEIWDKSRKGAKE